MAAGQRISHMRVRIFEFQPQGAGTFVDVLSSDVTDTYDNIRRHLQEVFANLPAHHFAIVCDALPNPSITLGYEAASDNVGSSESQEGSGMDQAPQGLARNQTATLSGSKPGRKPPSWSVVNGGEHSEIPADIQTGK